MKKKKTSSIQRYNERQERIDEAIIKRDKAINEKELLSQRQGRKFENEEELEKTRKKVEELTKLMKEELHEKELKYQAMLAEDEDMEEFDITDAIDQDIADDEDEEAARQAEEQQQQQQGDTPGGDTPGGDTPGGDTPGGDTPGGDTPGDEGESG